MPEDVQPAVDEGQGAEGTDSGLYDLDSVAPEHRDIVAPHLRAFDGKVTKKFQEAADYKKQWAPYEESGINDVPPETLQELLTFAKMANDPAQADQFNQWLTQMATERGLLGGSNDLDELDLEDENSPEKIEERLAQKVAEEIGPLKQFAEQWQQEQTQAKAEQHVEAAFTKAREEFPTVFEGEPEKQEKAMNFVVDLARGQLDGDDPDGKLTEKAVLTACKTYLDAVGDGEKSLFEKKADQPLVPEGPGAAATSPEKISSFSDPRLKEAALAKLKGSA
jgi:hypothetical protein